MAIIAGDGNGESVFKYSLQLIICFEVYQRRLLRRKRRDEENRSEMIGRMTDMWTGLVLTIKHVICFRSDGRVLPNLLRWVKTVHLFYLHESMYKMQSTT